MLENTANQEVRQQEEQATTKRAGLLGLKYQDSRDWSLQIPLYREVLSINELYTYHAVLVDMANGRMTFAITVNTPQSIIRNLRNRFLDYHINLVLISEAGFKELMLRYDPPKEVEYKDITIKTEGESDTLKQVSDTLETVRSDDILNYLITQADKLNASDIHFENEKESVRMRFRIDGTLHTIATLSKDKYRQLSSSIAVRANVSVANPDPQTGHLSQEFIAEDGMTKSLNMRIETVPAVSGQDVVIRIFNLDRELMKIENLGISKSLSEELEEIIRHPHGMVLSVGPTGSGKTTTLYSILERLNLPTRKIVTLEDPVEYNFEGVTQIPVKAQSGDQSFAENLRAVLRLDPDVIMIGEIRDVDTARTALQAALTGHLVLSTFHAANSAAALTRMLEIIGDNPLFASAIRLIIAQRLVRRLDDNSKQPYQLDDRMFQEVSKVVNELPDGRTRPDLNNLNLYKPGSSEDAPFGYKGRLMIAEQLKITPEIQELLRLDPSKVSTEDIHKLAVKQGMVTLMQDGILKAISGQTTVEEVFRTVDV